MNLNDVRFDFERAGIKWTAPALEAVEDFEPEDLRKVDETLRLFSGVGLGDANIGLFLAVRYILEFQAGVLDSEINWGRGHLHSLAPLAAELDDADREAVDTVLRMRTGVGIDEATVGLYCAVRFILDFRRKASEETRGIMVGYSGESHPWAWS